MSNHLGNILTVINDIKVPYLVGTDVAYYSTIVSTADYSPFGVQLDVRTTENQSKWGFQGQETDNEIKGEGNSVNYTYRMHDSRLGRFFAVDPLAAGYPWNSPYAFCENSVIAFIELEGLEKYYAADGTYLGQLGSNNQIRLVNSTDTRIIRQFKSQIETANKLPPAHQKIVSDYLKEQTSDYKGTLIATCQKADVFQELFKASNLTPLELIQKISLVETGQSTTEVSNVNAKIEINISGSFSSIQRSLVHELSNYCMKDKLNKIVMDFNAGAYNGDTRAAAREIVALEAYGIVYQEVYSIQSGNTENMPEAFVDFYNTYGFEAYVMVRYEQLTTIEALDAQVNASGQNAVDYYIEALEDQK